MQLNIFSSHKFMLLFILCLAFSSQTLLKSKKAGYDKTQVVKFLEEKSLDDLIKLSETSAKNTFTNDAKEVLFEVFNKAAYFIDEFDKEATIIINTKFTDNSKLLEFLENIHKQMSEKTIEDKVLKDFNSEYEKIKTEIEKDKEGTKISEELSNKLKTAISQIKARNSIIKPLAENFKTDKISSDKSTTEAIIKFVKNQVNNELQKAIENNENKIISCITGFCSFVKDKFSSKKRLLKSTSKVFTMKNVIIGVVIAVIVAFIGYHFLKAIGEAILSIIFSPLEFSLKGSSDDSSRSRTK